MIKIFHVPNTRSLRVIWLMEELEEPYEVETVSFPLDENFRALSPTASIPTIVDGDIVMGESIAILQYDSAITPMSVSKKLKLSPVSRLKISFISLMVPSRISSPINVSYLTVPSGIV